MRKDKAYSRQELESVRRADLQSLYKSHGLKGANKSTNLLIDELLALFATPQFASAHKIQDGSTRPGPSFTTATGQSRSNQSSSSASSKVGGGSTLTKAAPGGRPGQPYVRKLKSIESLGQTSKARDVKSRSATGIGEKRKLRGSLEKEVPKVEEPVTPILEEQNARTLPVAETPPTIEDGPEAGPSTSKLPRLPSQSQTTATPAVVDALNDRLQRLESQNAALAQSLEDKDRQWIAALLELEKRWEAKTRAERLEWERRLVKLELGTSAREKGPAEVPVARPSKHRRAVSFADEPEPSRASGKRSAEMAEVRGGTGIDISALGIVPRDSGEGRTDADTSLPAFKRPRLADPEASTEECHLRTPSPDSTAEHPIPPQTPPPSHQGIPPDNSKTPVIDSDFFAHPPTFVKSTARSHRRTLSEQADLPYPFFATTPKPSEPRSPTTDAPASASRQRTTMSQVPTVMLTPGRKRTQGVAPMSTSRAVSDAHKELSTITEEVAGPAGPSSTETGTATATATAPTRDRVSSADFGTPSRMFGPALSSRGTSVPISPPRLSPSPSIGEREAFTYTPFPPVPRRDSASLAAEIHRATPQATPMSHSALGPSMFGAEIVAPRTPPRRPMTMPLSPGQEYMDLALHGLPSPTPARTRPSSGGAGMMEDESPSAFATPGHRTLLGTERYRDTRFGDAPVLSWGTPSVDLGANTPRTSFP